MPGITLINIYSLPPSLSYASFWAKAPEMIFIFHNPATCTQQQTIPTFRKLQPGQAINQLMKQIGSK